VGSSRASKSLSRSFRVCVACTTCNSGSITAVSWFLSQAAHQGTLGQTCQQPTDTQTSFLQLLQHTHSHSWFTCASSAALDNSLTLYRHQHTCHKAAPGTAHPLQTHACTQHSCANMLGTLVGGIHQQQKNHQEARAVCQQHTGTATRTTVSDRQRILSSTGKQDQGQSC
jgi:hypothetical protein